MAERSGLSALVAVESAGLSGYHVGEGPTAGARLALSGRGYDGSAHRARRFDDALFDRCDLIVALDRSHLRDLSARRPGSSRAAVELLLSFDPARVDDLEVPDPYGGPPAAYEHALDLVEAGCAGLVAWIETSLREDGPTLSPRC